MSLSPYQIITNRIEALTTEATVEELNNRSEWRRLEYQNMETWLMLDEAKNNEVRVTFEDFSTKTLVVPEGDAQYWAKQVLRLDETALMVQWNGTVDPASFSQAGIRAIAKEAI